MQIHYIKLSYYYADAVYDGTKTFEIRKNDRGYQCGDLVRFKVVDSMGISYSHRLNEKWYRIKYLLHGYGLQDGYCVFGIEPYTGKLKENESDVGGLD